MKFRSCTIVLYYYTTPSNICFPRPVRTRVFTLRNSRSSCGADAGRDINARDMRRNAHATLASPLFANAFWIHIQNTRPILITYYIYVRIIRISYRNIYTRKMNFFSQIILWTTVGVQLPASYNNNNNNNGQTPTAAAATAV